MNLLGTEDPLAGVYGPSRFRAAYVAARRRLHAIAPERRGSTVFATCEELLTAAQEAACPWWRNAFRHPMRWQKMYVAWDCLHQFDRAILPLLSFEERFALWQSVRAQARHRLGGWRDVAADALIEVGDAAFSAEADQELAPSRPAGSIDAYLAAPAEVHTDVGIEILREALGHLHAQSQNAAMKVDRVSSALPVVFIVLVGIIVGTLWLAGAGWLNWLGLDPEQPDVAAAVFLGVLGGLLGGAMSMALGLGRVDWGSTAAELRLSRITLLIRPLLGAAAAIPVALLVNADVVQISGLSAPMAVFMLSIAAGFIERRFMRLLDHVSGARG